MSGISNIVAENRRDVRKIDRRSKGVDANSRRDLSFASNYIRADASIEVYTRPTGSQVVTGHPDASKGFGRGTFGDDRGAWTLSADVDASVEFTKSGRKAVAEALNGESGAIQTAAIGAGTSAAQPTDTALDTRLSATNTFAERSGATTAATAVFDSTDTAGDATEYGVFDGTGRLLVRGTVAATDIDVPPTHELRSITSITFDGDGRGSSVFTAGGEAALADSIRTPKVAVGPSEIRFGSGDTPFDTTDTSLTSAEVTKSVNRDPGRDRVTVESRITAADMSAVQNDLSEVGVFDTAGRLIWATTFAPLPSDTPGFGSSVTFVVS